MSDHKAMEQRLRAYLKRSDIETTETSIGWALAFAFSEVDRLKLEAAEAVGQSAPSPEQPSLDCAHCGCVAIESFTGIFYSGDGGHCRTCGFPGSVSCDSENPPSWIESDEDDATCADPDCDDCSKRDPGRVVGERPFVKAAAQTAEGAK